MRTELRSMKRATMAAAGNGKGRMHYGPLLLLAFAAAFLSVVVLQKLRERRVLGLLVQEQEQQLLALQVYLQKEKEQSKELRSRLEELRDKTISLVNQKTELNNKLVETEASVYNLETKQKEMEAALKEKENHINGMTEKAAVSTNVDQQITSLIQLLNEKEAEIDNMKRQRGLMEDNPAKENIVRNHSMTTHQGNGKLSEEDVEVGSENETAIRHKKTPQEKTWAQIEEEDEDDDEMKGDNDDTGKHTLGEKWIEELDFSHESEPGEEQIMESKEHKEEVKNVEPVGEAGVSKDARREGKGRQVNNKDEESEKLGNSKSVDDQKVGTDSTFPEETDRAKLKSRHGQTTRRNQIELSQDRKADQEHSMESKEQKEDLKNVNLFGENGNSKFARTAEEKVRQVSKDRESEKLGNSQSVDEQKVRTANFSEETNRAETNIRHGKKIKSSRGEFYPEHTMDFKDQKDIKKVELISGTVDSKNSRTEGNKSQFNCGRESGKNYNCPPVDNQKVGTDFNFAKEIDRTKMKIRHGKRIKRRSRSRRQHAVMKAEMPLGDQNQINSGNAKTSTVKAYDRKEAIATRNQAQTTGDDGSSHSPNKEQTLLLNAESLITRKVRHGKENSEPSMEDKEYTRNAADKEQRERRKISSTYENFHRFQNTQNNNIAKGKFGGRGGIVKERETVLTATN